MNKKVLLFVLFFISATVFFAWTKLNQEPQVLNEKQKREALENILGRDVREAKNIPQGEKAYQGKLFSLSHPTYAQVYDRENANITANKRLLEYFRLDSEDPKFRFVVIVEKAEDGAVLDELSGVRTRRLNKQHIEKQLTAGGNAGALFLKESDGVERSSFFLKDGRSFSFVITGLDVGELEKVYGEIIESVKF